MKVVFSVIQYVDIDRLILASIMSIWSSTIVRHSRSVLEATSGKEICAMASLGVPLDVSLMLFFLAILYEIRAANSTEVSLVTTTVTFTESLLVPSAELDRNLQERRVIRIKFLRAIILWKRIL